jgi:hypothetical protein
MKKLFVIICVSAALLATSSTAANAQHRPREYHTHYENHNYRHGGGGGGWVAPLVGGLIVGGIIGGAMTEREQHPVVCWNRPVFDVYGREIFDAYGYPVTQRICRRD